MSPRTYARLWIAYFALAGLIWLSGLMSLVATVAFGIVAFGLVFMGMMCVLPTAESHPAAELQKPERLATAPEQTKRRRSASARLFST